MSLNYQQIESEVESQIDGVERHNQFSPFHYQGMVVTLLIAIVRVLLLLARQNEQRR